VWSPDGTKIAYVMAPSQEDTFFDDYPGGTLYAVDVATGAARRLTAGTAPVWSPSGDQIAYMHTDGCSKSWIGTIHSDGTGLRHATDGHYDKYPAWSPNGKRLAYRHATTITGCYTIGAIWHVAADGSDAKPLIPATAVAAPKHSLVGMRAGAAGSILRPLGRHARVVGPDGTPAPAEWTVCLERQSSGPLGPELLAIATPICPFRAPRLIGMSYAKASRVISSIGALEDDDSSDPNYTKADIATNWIVCVQDPAAGARIPLSTTRQPMISIGLAPTCS